MSDLNKNDKWAQTSDKFVAFFDVMGFKDFVNTKSHKEVTDRIESLSNFTKILDSTSPIAKDIPTLGNYLKAILVSDSIILCSKGDTKEDLLCMTTAVGTLLSGCLQYNIPIKGAMSHGIFTYDSKKSIYVGKPLVNASIIESSLEFYGCVLDHCVEQKIESLNAKNFYKAFPGIKVPTKDGYIRYQTSRVVLNKSIEDTLSKFYKTVSGKPRKYIDNSILVYTELEKI